MSGAGLLLLLNGIYLAAVLGIGLLAARRAGQSPEEYYLAGRGFRTPILFFSVFATNVTPFVLVGIPGIAYHDGIGVFGANAAIVALGIPLTLWGIGYPASLAARGCGALTPAELYTKRFENRWVGLLLFLFFTLYTLPYMVTGVLGIGVTVEAMTDGAVSFPLAAAILLAVAMLYTTLGGMRATAWTNVFQGSLFLGFTTLAFFLMAGSMGGFEAAMDRVRERVPGLLVKEGHAAFEPRAWASWGFAISLTVIAFPHILVRLFAARDPAAIRNVCRLYPPALALLWLPAVMLGVWGAAEFPGLEGKASDRIFGLMVARHLPEALGAVGLAGLLAAVMSTLDAQLLTISSMVTRDLLGRFFPSLAAGRDVRIARITGVVLAAGIFAVALLRPASIFDVAKFSFSGYVTLVPVLWLGVRWKRLTAAGAIASLLAGNGVYAAAYLGWIPSGGFLPVMHGLVAALAAAVVVSLLGRPPEGARTAAFFAPIDRVIGG